MLCQASRHKRAESACRTVVGFSMDIKKSPNGDDQKASSNENASDKAVGGGTPSGTSGPANDNPEDMDATGGLRPLGVFIPAAQRHILMDGLDPFVSAAEWNAAVRKLKSNRPAD